MQQRAQEIRLREATLDDAEPIARLMGTLGYPACPEVVNTRLEAIFSDPAYRTVVAELGGVVYGVVGLHRLRPYEMDTPLVQILAIAVDEVQRSRKRHATPSGHSVYDHMGFRSTALNFVKRIEEEV